MSGEKIPEAYYFDKTRLNDDLDKAIATFDASLQKTPASFSMMEWRAICVEHSREIDRLTRACSPTRKLLPRHILKQELLQFYEAKQKIFERLQFLNSYYPLNFGSTEDKESAYEQARSGKRNFLDTIIKEWAKECEAKGIEWGDKKVGAKDKGFLAVLAENFNKFNSSTSKDATNFLSRLFTGQARKEKAEDKRARAACPINEVGKALKEFDAKFRPNEVNIDILAWSYTPVETSANPTPVRLKPIEFQLDRNINEINPCIIFHNQFM